MSTPIELVGVINPRTGRPYGREIRESLGSTRNLIEARRLRDLRLGEIRREQADANGSAEGSLEAAMKLAAELPQDYCSDEQDDPKVVLVERAERLAQTVGEERAKRWYKTALRAATPFATACEQYKADGGKTLSRSTLNNLDTAIREFKEFAGEEVALQDVDRRMVGRFVSDFLPSKKTPKAPEGQGPATIRKKVSMLAQVWRWAQQRGFLPYSKETPWDEQGPSKKDIKAAASERRPLVPAEAVKLLAAAPGGEALGDLIRVALLTGVRLEQAASLDAS